MKKMINRIVLVGRLTRDPEMRRTQSDVAVTNFTLAVDRPFTNRNGERETDFIRIVTWRSLAEACVEHLSKGRLVGVDGRLQIRSFNNKEGERVTIAEVVADNVRFLEPKGGAGGRKEAASESGYDADPFSGASDEPLDIPDDDLPF